MRSTGPLLSLGSPDPQLAGFGFACGTSVSLPALGALPRAGSRAEDGPSQRGAVRDARRACRAYEVRRPMGVEYRATTRAGLGASSRVGLVAIWLGGSSEAAYDRAARLAGRFIFIGDDINHAIDALKLLRDRVRNLGRTVEDFGAELSRVLMVARATLQRRARLGARQVVPTSRWSQWASAWTPSTVISITSHRSQTRSACRDGCRRMTNNTRSDECRTARPARRARRARPAKRAKRDWASTLVASLLVATSATGYFTWAPFVAGRPACRALQGATRAVRTARHRRKAGLSLRCWIRRSAVA